MPTGSPKNITAQAFVDATANPPFLYQLAPEDAPSFPVVIGDPLTVQLDPKQAPKLRTANAAQVCPDGAATLSSATLTRRVVTRRIRICEAVVHITASDPATPTDRDNVLPW